jgi:hypothetical protein
MATLLDYLLKETGADLLPKAFEPVARYYGSMDFLLFLKEDVSYRADRVDPFLTVLWHPEEDRLVGVKLKGFRFIFERLKSLLDLQETQWLPVVKAIELAMVGGWGQGFIDKHERERDKERVRAHDFRDKYQKAMEVAREAKFDPSQLKDAA